MLEMRSNISIGGRGSWALPGPNSAPRQQVNKSSYSKLVRRSAIAFSFHPL
jgi:hypothetical protein